VTGPLPPLLTVVVVERVVDLAIAGVATRRLAYPNSVKTNAFISPP